VGDNERREDRLAIVMRALQDAWAAGSPVAHPPHDDTARIALRRYASIANRDVDATDTAARVRDLAKGLVAAFERDPKIGELMRD
jgi:hypothetical protein